MSFTFEGRDRYGALTPEGVADLSDGPWPDLRALLAGGGLAQLDLVVAAARRTLPLDILTLLPPIPRPDKILCVGLAYHAHVAELGRRPPKHPSLFLRLPGSFVGHGQPVVRPRNSEQFDYEAELGVYIGRGGRHIPVEQAMDHVAGYTCVAENSVRDYQAHNLQVTPGKNFDCSGAVGPWLVTADELRDSGLLQLTGRLNGKIMQQTNTSDLIFSVAEVIAYISEFATLTPGDLIATGTPAGVGSLRTPSLFMVSGDRFDVEIECIGTLSNIVQ